MKYNKSLINKYAGTDKFEFFDSKKEMENFVKNIKIGKLYFTTEKINGAAYPPEKTVLGDEVLWMIGARYLQKNFGLTADEAKRKAVFTEIFANSIILPVEISKDGELIRVLHESKILWFSTKYLALNTTLVPVDKIVNYDFNKTSSD